ncbi:receptor-like protein EIX2 [Cicer arietinum]|uniref:Receptor-like protein EIX1 n=1 Tax=Cicer arietinum TaxID=3827 RepID=A0A1S2YMA4_CICAR|nr:receptor-like protein EIX1 [Cicer arietinum]
MKSLMTILTSQMSFLLLVLFYITTFHKSMSSNHKVVGCNEKDKKTLLMFKNGLIDDYHMISTWTIEKDCCSWEGVYCDNITDRVTKVDLSFNNLEGKINLCILELEFLSYLDLRDNAFDVISLPTIQHNITHASKLVYLDLSFNHGHRLHMDNLHWLSPLSSLKYLNLGDIDLHNETNWLQMVVPLPSLLEFRCSACNLNNFTINLSIENLNLTSLQTLDLSFNNFNSKLPKQLFNLTKDLSYLDLSVSNIVGEIPSSLSNLRNLSFLDLSVNQFKGSFPDGIGQLEYIEYLDISYNQLKGSILDGIGQLTHLHYLDISRNMLNGSNDFSGVISQITFSNLSRLEFLDLSWSNFVFQFDLEWIPPFQLRELCLEYTNQGPNFPSWIYTQKSLKVLDLSNSGISLIDINKFSNLIEGILHLYLSNNSLIGDISNLTLKCHNLYLDHNNFTGGLPNISPMVYSVDLSYNSFSGSIPHSWKNLKDIYYINLWSNALSGEVLGHLSNLKQLIVMNLGENEFSGTIPINMSQQLEVIILRGNQFEGIIPTQLFNLSSLFHLDLAYNKLSGSISECVYNLTHMVTYHVTEIPRATVNLFTKGQDYVYEVRPERRTIDLSSNNFSGKVPMELFRLVQLQTLNLSHNNFIGTIPKTIGGMKNMESLDLSNNKFCGEIPQSMVLLNFLDYLNISYNNFSGKIPTGTQLQSFNASSYIGNPNLCGAPLKNCTTEEENHKYATPSKGDEDCDSFREFLYLGMGVGFAVSFWGICGSLFLIRKWRHTYFRFLDQVVDKLYVALMVKLNNFH